MASLAEINSEKTVSAEASELTAQSGIQTGFDTIDQVTSLGQSAGSSPEGGLSDMISENSGLIGGLGTIFAAGKLLKNVVEDELEM